MYSSFACDRSSKPYDKTSITTRATIDTKPEQHQTKWTIPAFCPPNSHLLSHCCIASFPLSGKVMFHLIFHFYFDNLVLSIVTLLFSLSLSLSLSLPNHTDTHSHILSVWNDWADIFLFAHFQLEFSWISLFHFLCFENCQTNQTLPSRSLQGKTCLY